MKGKLFFFPIMRLCAFFVIAVCVCVLSARVLAEDGRDFVLQAYKNRGDNIAVIKTCFVEFSLVSLQPMSESQYKQEAERRRAYILEKLAGHKNPEKLLAGLEKSLRENQLKPQNIKGNYLHRLSEIDQQRQSLFNIFYSDMPGKQLMPTTVISEAGPQRVVSAILQPENRVANVLPTPGFVAEFYQMGRIAGTPIDSLLDEAEKASMGIAEILKNRNYQVTGTETYDDNSQMTLVEYKKGGRLVERYGIDSSKGYVCPIIQVFDEKTGKPTEEYISKAFFLHAKSRLWFPTSYTAKRYNVLTGELISEQEFTIDVHTLKINQPVSEKEFAIDIPVGFKIDDSRYEEFTRYTVFEKGAISLAPKGLDFTNMKWLAQELPESEYLPPSGGAPGWVRWSLMSIGGLLILYALGRMLCEKICKKP